MKKLLFALCALAAISLLAPSAGFADAWVNRIGAYTTATADATYIETTPVGDTISMFFVVGNPQFNDGSPMSEINAFELKLTVTGPATGFIRSGETFPPNAMDLGAKYPSTKTFEYVVGWPAALPVVNGLVSVCQLDVIVTKAGPWHFFMGPTAAPSVPGYMAINSTDGSGAHLVGCTPSSGSELAEVFTIGAVNPSVDVQAETFGDVKALFR